MPPVRNRTALKMPEETMSDTCAAHSEAQIGNTVGAENYYQYAEHYFRTMRSDSEGT